VRHPDWFDVVVGSNLFGDILSDLGPAGGRFDRHRALGQHHPEREYPSMFEPVHGSAPDHRRTRHRQPDRPDLVGVR